MFVVQAAVLGFIGDSWNSQREFSAAIVVQKNFRAFRGRARSRRDDASIAATTSRYVCVAKAIATATCEYDHNPSAINPTQFFKPGDVVEVLSTAVTTAGIKRAKVAHGWISFKSLSGVLLFEPVPLEPVLEELEELE